MKNHPDRDEWVPYLFGEVDPQTRKNLASHLNACPECAEELRGWRKSLQQLDTWKAPSLHRPRVPVFRPVLNLAAAAVFVLGIGFGIGRWVSTNRLTPAMESSLRASLVPQLREQVLADLQRQVASLDSARADEQHATAAWVEELRKQHENDFISLRRDLETVATTTDDRIRAAQLRLLELAAFTPDPQH
jgi:anti-sigma factor RsiW